MIRRTALFVCTLLSLTTLAATAAAAAAQDVQAGAGKTTKLFNGKDLTGWVWHQGEQSNEPAVPIEEVWTVKEEGVLHTKGHPIGYIRTEKDYTNYKLTLEWRFPGKPGNGGVLLRMQPPDKVWPKSIEAQLQHQHAGDFWNIDEFPMTVAKERTKGRNTKKEHPSNEKPPGEWNKYEITLDGGRVELKVNDLVQNVASDALVVPGKICLQSEGSEMEFRNIELTPIESKEKPPSDKPAANKSSADKSSAGADGKRRLAGLEGWHVTGNGNWTVTDGVIEGKQPESEKSYTHVVSDKSYTDFKASLKFKALKGNSGFYFRVKPEASDRMVGIQAEIDEKNNVGGLYESYGRQWLSLPKPEVVASYFKPQEWNEMTVEGRGPHVIVHVNGEKAAEINDPTIRTDGPFALQIHGGQDVHVMFKDIRIEDLCGGTSADKRGGAGETTSTSSMQRIAAEIYASLTPEQRKQATRPIDAPERTREEFTGGKRPGVHIKTLNREQQKRAESLLTAFCSDYGQRKAMEIAEQESNTADPTTGFERYYLCFFGEPGEGQTYAWRIAEHHLTIVHVEVANGEATSLGPILLGANPPTLWDEEEEKLLALYAAMSPAERAESHQPGRGISTEYLQGDGGIRVGDLGRSARQAAQAMLDHRLAFFSDAIAARVKQMIDSQGGIDAMRIAFYGKVDRKCRDGGRWDFKLASPRDGFLCDYEGSRAHIHLSMKGKLAEQKPKPAASN